MDKKEICLALGQGGARCLAHIGVLQIFQEQGIKIKKISGTSAGAIVGAVFSETEDAFETEERFRTLLKSEAYANSGLNNLKDHSVNGVSFWEQITTRIRGMIALNLAQSKLGVLKNINFKKCLKILVHGNDFSRLRIPFSAMATDLISGYSVEISSGDIIVALNASAAIPGFFPPVPWDDHLLVDGAVCCPVPVEHCRIHENDVTVAVHVPAKINPDYRPENALDIMVRAEEINMRNLDQVKTSRADIKIFPDTKDVDWNELHRLDEMIASGRAAAKEALPNILATIESRTQTGIESMNPSAGTLFNECHQYLLRL